MTAVRDCAGFALMLTLLALVMLSSGLESVAAHVPRRTAKAPRPAPRHRKTKALAVRS